MHRRTRSKGIVSVASTGNMQHPAIMNALHHHKTPTRTCHYRYDDREPNLRKSSSKVVLEKSVEHTRTHHDTQQSDMIDNDRTYKLQSGIVQCAYTPSRKPSFACCTFLETSRCVLLPWMWCAQQPTKKNRCHENQTACS
jgi:hypothetical protein